MSTSTKEAKKNMERALDAFFESFSTSKERLMRRMMAKNPDYFNQVTTFIADNLSTLLDPNFSKKYSISVISSGVFEFTEKIPFECTSEILTTPYGLLYAYFERYGPEYQGCLNEEYLFNRDFKILVDAFVIQNTNALSTHNPLVIHPLPNPIHSNVDLQLLCNTDDLDPMMPLS